MKKHNIAFLFVFMMSAYGSGTVNIHSGPFGVISDDRKNDAEKETIEFNKLAEEKIQEIANNKEDVARLQAEVAQKSSEYQQLSDALKAQEAAKAEAEAKAKAEADAKAKAEADAKAKAEADAKAKAEADAKAAAAAAAAAAAKGSQGGPRGRK